MTELLTAAQMRELEQAAMSNGLATGIELMERAGRGVVDAVFSTWPELRKTSFQAAILCGPGNNGGDGFVIARLLHEWGWDVAVFLFGQAKDLRGDAKQNYDRWISLGDVAPMKGVNFEDRDLIIDACFGTGVARAVPDDIFWALAAAHQAQLDGAKLVAVDQPSTLCTDSGRYFLPCSEDAYDLTVTFHQRKLCHALADGPRSCGVVVCVDIGLGDAECVGSVEQIEIESNSADMLRKFSDAHKYDHGHALVISGPSGKGGAARLAARCALRVGAGLVTIACPPDAIAENAAQLNAIMLDPVADEVALGKVLDDRRKNAVCIGPGLGVGASEKALIARCLRSRRPVVLDADALTMIGGDADLFDALHPDCVLTPHGGEFARLFPDMSAQLTAAFEKGPAYSKVDAVRAAAKRAGCVVLLKGVDTVIADPNGRCVINLAAGTRAAPWLATAGSGDVLAGMITGLLARGFAPIQAAETGAWLHTECALSFGPGLIAEDLPEQLPCVFTKLIGCD